MTFPNLPSLPALLLVAAVLGLSELPAPARADDDDLWQRLKTDPNMVVLMRHTHSSGGNPLTWDRSGACNGESVLSARGKAHARQIGQHFAARGIEPLVVSSPMCRCLQTAQLAFGTAPMIDDDLRELASADAERVQAHNARAQSLLARNRGAAPVVLVSHRPNIDQLTMELLDDGDLLIGTISESGEVEIQGKIAIKP